MKLDKARVILLVAIAFLVLSVTLGVASIYAASSSSSQTKTLIDDTFHLSPNEDRRQGIGNFRGNSTIGNGTIDETLTVKVESSDVFVKNFSVVVYSGCQFNISTSENITYTFPTGADYYEAIFTVDGNNSGVVHFQAVLTQPQLTYPLSWLSVSAKIMFLFSVAAIVLVLLLEGVFNKIAKTLKPKQVLQSISKTDRRVLVALLVVSLAFWFMVLALNSNPLGTYENWYTDHARHSYTASLFLKDGLSVFNQPLDTLASSDSSRFMFVTWPEMPHLYPIGSIALFLPFGVLLQSGVDAVLVYKLEIALFLVVAHVCLYFFLSRYLAQRPFPQLRFGNAKQNIQTLKEGDRKQQSLLVREYLDVVLVLIGVYIIYTSLVTFAADGMFDAVPFLFLVLAVLMFLSERYDGFLLLIGVSVIFKYQTAIFLFPLIIVGVVKLLESSNLAGLIKNKVVVLSVVFAGLSGFTAYLSAPYLIRTRPEIIMNAIAAFSPHAQILWTRQAFAILLTLAVTLVYAGYMLNKNKLLSMSAIFMLLPVFVLPYFQNWYLPYLFVYALIPQRKNEFTATVIWLIFMVIVLSFGGSAFDPRILIQHFDTMIHSTALNL